jgi:phosphatidylglycerol:prolipoprotein diacylglycerol transferase
MIWDIDPVLLRLGPLEIRYYGVFFATALLGGLYFWRAQMVRGGHSAEMAENPFIVAVVAVLVGARLGHVIFYEPQRFMADPVQILYVWKGGLASHGAITAIILTVLWFSRKHRMPFLEVGDRLSFGMIWGGIMVRLGNFMNSEIVGRATDSAWGVKFTRYDWRLPLAQVPARHPSQLYEALMAAVILAVLFWADRVLGGERRPRGAITYLVLLLYFSGRFTVEFVKEYQTLEAADAMFTMGQYLSLPFMLVGLVGLVYTLGRRQKTS